MTTFLVVLAVLFAVLVFLSVKYKNPYKLHYVFGKKGAGKSLFLTQQMLKYKRRGWTIYTDMSDINIPGVRVIQNKDLEFFRPEPKSALFLDEVGITYDNRKFKSLPDGIRDFYKFLRKMKCTCFMNSQSYDVDKKIRDTVDEMYLLQNILGCITLVRPIRRHVKLIEATGESESRIADDLKFKSLFSWRFIWCPRYFKYFNTASMPEREVIPYESSRCPDTSDSQTGGGKFRFKFGFYLQLGKLGFYQLRSIVRTRAKNLFRRKNDDD